jgi:hypothetical protein
MCSQKCARPTEEGSSINEPTPTERLTADFVALLSDIKTASIPFFKFITLYLRVSDKGLWMSIFIYIQFKIILRSSYNKT